MNLIDNPRIAAFMCVLIWSSIAVVAKLGQNNIDFYQFLFISNLVSLGSVILVSLSVGRSFSDIFLIRPSIASKAMCLGVLDCLFYLSIYRGYGIANGVAVLVAQYSWPIMIVILSSIRDSKWPSQQKFVGLVIGMAAICIALTKGDLSGLKFSDPSSILIVIAGAFCFAMLSTLSKDFIGDIFVGNVWLFYASCITSLFLYIFFGSAKTPSYSDLAPILINGALINGVSYILWAIACTKGDVSETASLVFLSPVLSALWLVGFFHEPFVPAYVIALVLVLVSGLLCMGGGTSLRNGMRQVMRGRGQS